jgi:hypothetical protein
MKTSLLSGVLSIAVLALPNAALAFRSINGQDVNPMANGVFEVVGKPGAGPREYWCSAGHYARAMLRAAANQRIYITRGLGQSETTNRRSAVQFSLTKPPGDYQSGYSLSIKNVGENLTAAAASNYCAGSRRFF